MARTIRYLTPVAARQGVKVGAQSHRGATKELDVDGYLERLAKYVPVEILTPFTALMALAKDRPGLLWGTFIGMALLVPAYLFITRVLQPTDTKTKFRPYMYLLSPIAFFIWALNTSEPFRTSFASLPVVAQFANVDAAYASIVLFFGALVIPGIDVVLDYWLANREAAVLDRGQKPRPPAPAPAGSTCIDFSTMTPVAHGLPGTSPNPWSFPTAAGMVKFTTFNPVGSAMPGQALNNRLWEEQAHTGLDCNFHLEIDLPASSTVTLSLVHFSRPAVVSGLDSSGATVAKVSQGNLPNVVSAVTLSGVGIEKVMVDSPADEVILTEFCFS